MKVNQNGSFKLTLTVHLMRLVKRFGTSQCQECIDRLLIHAQKMKDLDHPIKVRECVIRQSLTESSVFAVELTAKSPKTSHSQLIFCLLEFLRQELMMRHYRSVLDVNQVSIVLDAKDIDFSLLVIPMHR
jgi:hypothetical protein